MDRVMNYIRRGLLYVVLLEASVINAQINNTNTPDYPIISSNLLTQSENHVFIHPDNPTIVLNSNNYSPFPLWNDGIYGILIEGVSAMVSTNGGNAWSGISGLLLNSMGDPITVINKNGDMFISYISVGWEVSVARSIDNGATWNETLIFSPSILGSNYAIVDKSYLGIDNRKFKSDGTNNPYYGNLYSAWAVLNSSNNDGIMFSKSNDNGNTWTANNLVTNIDIGFTQGAIIKTGTNGEVYGCWMSIQCTSNVSTSVDFPPNLRGVPSATQIGPGGTNCYEYSIRFNKSTDGGQTWQGSIDIVPINGVSKFISFNKQMRINSFPSMAVNQQNGHIYVVWTELIGNGGPASHTDVYFIKSTDGGDSWTFPPIRVHVPSNKDQFMPWIACDEITNAIVVVYYDSRNFPNNNKVETFVSISYDDGNTWQDFQISDVGADWDGSGITNGVALPLGIVPNYAGDYIGIDVLNGRAVPVWSDKRAGNMLAYTQPFDIPCPSDLDLKYGNYFITDEVSFSEDAAYSATNKIYVAGQTTNNSTYKIYPNASVYMSAGTEIELDDGFESEGEFVAEIAPCTNISSRMNNSVSKNLTDNKNILLYSVPSNDVMKNESSFCRIFPNPTQNGIYITSLTNIHSVLLKDLTGKILLQQNFPAASNAVTLDVSTLSNGLYLVEIHTDVSVATEKIIVQR